jgi:hypothetical protein
MNFGRCVIVACLSKNCELVNYRRAYTNRAGTAGENLWEACVEAGIGHHGQARTR